MVQTSIAVLDCSISNNPLRPMYAYQSRGERRGPNFIWTWTGNEATSVFNVEAIGVIGYHSKGLILLYFIILPKFYQILTQTGAKMCSNSLFGSSKSAFLPFFLCPFMSIHISQSPLWKAAYIFPTSCVVKMLRSGRKLSGRNQESFWPYDDDDSIIEKLL